MTGIFVFLPTNESSLMEQKSKLWYFENFNLLESLTMKEMEELGKMTSMKNSSKGQVIYFSEDVSNRIYFLKAGKVKISRYSQDGKEVIINILGPGEIFGELALMDQGNRNEIAEVTEEAVICGVDINDLEQMLAMNPKFNLRITKFIGLKLKRIQNRLTSLIFKSSEERIRGFIKEISEEHGKIIGDEISVKLNLTHEDIAKLTATSRQTVTNVFSELEKHGVIFYDRRQILIRDVNAL